MGGQSKDHSEKEFRQWLLKADGARGHASHPGRWRPCGSPSRWTAPERGHTVACRNASCLNLGLERLGLRRVASMPCRRRSTRLVLADPASTSSSQAAKARGLSITSISEEDLCGLINAST